MGKRSSHRKNNKEAPRRGMKEKMTEILELPKEVVLNMPKLTMLGNGNLIIENYKGVVEYDDNCVRVNTTSGIIKISGEKLVIKEITSEDIMVDGWVSSMEFLR